MDQRNRRDLSLVNTVGEHCRIFRETTGSYLVSLQEDGRDAVRVATLACAYAACREREQQRGSS
jgi:hypothetical protein